MIAGGGFGGFYAARALERLLPAQSARVTLVNEANFMLYTPLLPGAAGATLDPRHVSVPLRSQLRRTELVIGRVSGRRSGAARARRRADRRRDGASCAYDQLVVALGSVSRTLPIPGLAEHAIGLKSLSDATALRNQVLQLPGHRRVAGGSRAAPREYLGFVFVGAGYAGVEGLAELQDFAAQTIELYPRCRAQGMRWVLVEARERIMQEVPPSLSDFAEGELRRTGHRGAHRARRCSEIDERGATLSDGETIPARTVVWTAGVKPSPAVARLGLPLDAEREDRRRRDDARRPRRAGSQRRRRRAPACGRSATAPPCPTPPGRASPARRRPSTRSARAGSSRATWRPTLGGGAARPFRYRTKGVVAELGQQQGRRDHAGHPLARLPGLVDRAHLSPAADARRGPHGCGCCVDWNVALLFGRDASSPGRLGSPTPLEGDEPVR